MLAPGGPPPPLAIVRLRIVWSETLCGSYLPSVSYVSATECVAVGYTDTDSNKETLVLSLTGPVPPSTTTTTVASDPVVPAFTG
jgi:hypothetical protein